MWLVRWCLVVGLMLAGQVWGGQIVVPDDYASIGQALAAAAEGDEIVVLPGRYVENLVLPNRSLTLRGSDPSDPNVVATTIIDGSGAGIVLKCVADAGKDIRIAGLSIVNGKARLGAGIYNQSSATVENCRIEGNDGGGMLNENSSSVITGCTFSGNLLGNDSWKKGAGMWNKWSQVTVTDCTFEGNGPIGYTDRGGGMYNDYSDVVVTRCDFVENSAAAGGGVYNYGCAPVVAECVFTGNVANYGGGMYSSDSSGTIEKCAFATNMAYFSGGGMYNYHSSPEISDCSFAGNRTDNSHNDPHAGGGAMYNKQVSGPAITRCVFSNNAAGDGRDNRPSGDGVSAELGANGGAMFNYNSSPPITQCRFEGNCAGRGGDHEGGLRGGYGGRGGAMWNTWESSPTLIGCSFISNRGGDGGRGGQEDYGFYGLDGGGGGGGGAIFSNGGSPMIVGCDFRGNRGGNGGTGNDGIYAGDGGAGGDGGAMAACSTELTAVNCVFFDNGGGDGGSGGSRGSSGARHGAGGTGGNGGGVYSIDGGASFVNCTYSQNLPGEGGLNGSGLVAGADGLGGGISNEQCLLEVVNCILWPDTLVSVSTPAATVRYSCLQVWPGVGNIAVDPRFVDVAEGNLALRQGSPCIGAGDTSAVPAGITIDLGGTPRVIDSRCDGLAGVDMGAYEYHRTILAAWGDAQPDCSIGLGDYAVLASHWQTGQCGWCGGADLTGDGMVDIADLQVLAGHWLTRGTPQ